MGVNLNIFASKADVYLDGGPQGGGSGLPDGSYFIQVTEPDGTVLGRSNTAVAQVVGGEFVQCYQLMDVLYTASSNFTVQGFDDTSNTGGVYKVGASQVATFPNSQSKTDNFKVTEEEDYEFLAVSKTAVTSYSRSHDWSIDKAVDPAALYLYTDGSGDATVEWAVDVTYEGYMDDDWNVSGVITITNSGTLDAVITEVVDVLYADTLAGMPIDVVCGVMFPYTLLVGETLTCTYDQDLDEAYEGANLVTVTTDLDVYDAEAALVWGDPDPDNNAVVEVSDESDLFGAVTLGTLSAYDYMAGDVETFTYTKDFAWADYGQDECGDYSYGNSASVIGDDDAVLDSADATLAVYVQCFVFDDETAWAANGDTPGQLRYNPRGNWATYVEYAEKTTTLFAGQTIDVGTVEFSAVVDGEVTITVTLTAPWVFADVYENLKVQDYGTAPSGNPAPGRFAHKVTCDAEVSSCVIVVPANNFYGVHVDVGQWIPDPGFGP